MTICTADNAAIERGVELLQQGQLVAFPTETVYGLGADASNTNAVQKIFQAKGRPSNHPLIVHIADATCLSHWAAHVPDAALRLAEHFWPGPLAIILNKADHVPLAVTGGQHTVGLRVPHHPVALQLLRAFGGGIAAPSANRFCRISPTQAQHVAEELGDSVSLILDGGACEIGVESTIVDLSSATPRLLRYGQISTEQIQAVLQTELLLPQGKKPLPTEDIRAPGMIAIHYAPLTTAWLCTQETLPTLVTQLTAKGQRVGVMAYSSALMQTDYMTVLMMPKTASDYAQNLYAALRELDRQQYDAIIVEQPPTTAEWSAINDRLSKATTPG